MEVRRNSSVLATLCVLIVLRGGVVVRAAALNNFPSVRFVTDNSLATTSTSTSHSDDHYGSVPGIDKQSIEGSNKDDTRPRDNHGIISADIYWGSLVESSYPRGFSMDNYTEWNSYVNSDGTRILQLEQDKCGRMQNRLVTFADGTSACARYRQNIDQIQGELFSFYLGQLLKLSNMAPTALHVVNEDSHFWANASGSVQEAGWKAQRPVVLTKHIPGLQPSGIPSTFRKLERHLNKFDVTLGMKNSVEEGAAEEQTAGVEAVGVGNLLADMGSSSTSSSSSKIWPSINCFNIKSSHGEVDERQEKGEEAVPSSAPSMSNLLELAQWSDLVVFDYLIAHLDRVVNNLYNFQWNSEIMLAPTHNLAKDPKTELLLFLDNESGLLHGYRLLHKYQAYHSLLLENLCIFRRSTIDQLRWLEGQDVGKLLNGMYLRATPEKLSGFLPLLPEKSIVILRKRISQVLRHVDKCQRMFANNKL